MKKLLLILSLVVTGLSGCYVEPVRVNDGGYRHDRDHREDRDQRRDHDERERDDRGGERGGRDGYR